MPDLVWAGGWATSIELFADRIAEYYPGYRHRFIDILDCFQGGGDPAEELGRLMGGDADGKTRPGEASDPLRTGPLDGIQARPGEAGFVGERRGRAEFVGERRGFRAQKPAGLVAWSLGSLVALEAFRKSALPPGLPFLGLSPIFDFCGGDSPWPEALLRRMEKQLETRPAAVLESFWSRLSAGIEEEGGGDPEGKDGWVPVVEDGRKAEGPGRRARADLERVKPEWRDQALGRDRNVLIQSLRYLRETKVEEDEARRLLAEGIPGSGMGRPGSDPGTPESGAGTLWMTSPKDPVSPDLRRFLPLVGPSDTALGGPEAECLALAPARLRLLFYSSGHLPFLTHPSEVRQALESLLPAPGPA